MIYVIIGVLFYLIGVVLAYGSYMASMYEIDEDYPMLQPTNEFKTFFIYFIMFFSWIAVLAGFIVHFLVNERYYFKWSKKELVERYNKRRL